jgi:choline dehydrogenase-like flavoprotein
VNPADSASERRYDAIVVGAGAAGCEAALRLAEGGRDVLLTTTSLDTVFAAPLERVPVDELSTGLGAELAAKLPVADDGAVASWELHRAAKSRLEAVPAVHLLQSSVDALRLRDGAVEGVETWEGVPRRARRVALCVGPFLRARLSVGAATERAGRPGEMAYDELADDLAARGLELAPCRDRGGGGGRPAWTRTYLRIAPTEVSGVRVPRFGGLYAAGACVHGDMDYASAAADGATLAAAIDADLSGGGGSA